MTEQEKRDNVIKELQESIADAVYPDRPRKFIMSLKLAEDALAILKAQEPRVMTWQEIIDTATQMPFIWLESKEKHDRVFQSILFKTWLWDSMATIITVMTQGWLFVGHQVDYDKTWRCWTSRPTDAQREAVKWE